MRVGKSKIVSMSPVDMTKITLSNTEISFPLRFVLIYLFPIIALNINVFLKDNLNGGIQ